MLLSAWWGSWAGTSSVCPDTMQPKRWQMLRVGALTSSWVLQPFCNHFRTEIPGTRWAQTGL
jgi:hypothetical protein